MRRIVVTGLAVARPWSARADLPGLVQSRWGLCRRYGVCVGGVRVALGTGAGR
ncbi:hypothetical protein [Pseudonocardia sp.]|uniref:hypothetical protein n=1 Tax=Pseudonocardia sp. TaxID=60912 RepID=UPI002EDA617A